MFCPHCGKTIDAGVRFCPACGMQIVRAAYSGPAAPATRLLRPRNPRMIAGVCSAFATQYGWDLSVVRIVTVVLALLTSGFIGLCYLAAWVIIPDAPYALPSGTVYTPPPPAGSAGNSSI